VLVFAVFFILLFPYPVHAGSLLGDLAKCGPDEVISLSGFLYFFARVAQWILGITGSLALLMFVVGGFIWLISGGSQKMIDLGRTTLVNALIGMAIVFGSWMFIGFILQTIAPGTYSGGGWFAFNKTLCESAKQAALGGSTSAPQPPAAAPPTRTERALEQHSQDLAIKCMDEKTAKTYCDQCRLRNGLPTLVYTDTSTPPVPCGTGKARCECQDKKTGLKCDGQYPRPSYKECTCGKGDVIMSSKADSKNVPLKDATGKPYFCCACAKKKTAAAYLPCGSPATTIDQIRISWDKNPYRECTFKAPKYGSLGRCDREGAAIVQIDGKNYCLWGGEGSICNRSLGEGVESGCATQDLKCVPGRDLVYDQCDRLADWWGCVGNLARYIVRAPAGWTADRFRDLAKWSNLGVCVLKK